MVTPQATPVNGPPPRAVMMSIAAIAARDQVKKPGVSRRVKQLRKSGLHVELDGQGRVALVDVVQYDALKDRFSDPAKAQAPVSQASAVPPPEGQNETYDEARRVLTWTEARRAELKLEAEQGLYVKTADLAVAVDKIGEQLAQVPDRLVQAADDLAAAVAQQGVHGLRAALKKIGFEMKTDIADMLAGLVNERTS